MIDTGIPDGVVVETVYVVEVSYAADAPEKRPGFRAEHLTRIARLMNEGRVIEAGGFLDMSAALLFVRASSEAEAEALVSDDVYLRNGVWLDDARARPYGRVILADDEAAGARLR
jgi:uncharacterized protein YciI